MLNVQTRHSSGRLHNAYARQRVFVHAIPDLGGCILFNLRVDASRQSNSQSGEMETAMAWISTSFHPLCSSALPCVRCLSVDAARIA